MWTSTNSTTCNFQSKDDLYLQCLKICYEQMLDYLKSNTAEAESVSESLRNLFIVRQTFFSEHPYYANIFFHSVLQPPKHLLEYIQTIRLEFDLFYKECYQNMIRHLPLRNGITEEMALEYFSIFVESFNEYFQKKSVGSNDYPALIEAHEDKLSGILDILLYGIAAPNN